jgi:uncharacterized iron-regulated membrane protein
MKEKSSTSARHNHPQGDRQEIDMNRVFRRYHRKLAFIMCLPLTLTAIAGIAYPILSDWLVQKDLAEFVLRIHAGDFLGLASIYPILNGLGLVGLLVSGLSMMSRSRRPIASEQSEPATAKSLVKR